MGMDIAIIGIGLYPFGRHDGVTALEMGVQAARRALDDAGCRWADMHLACAGSLEVLQPDTMTKYLGLTGIPFTTLFNGCATGGNLLLTTANAISANILIHSFVLVIWSLLSVVHAGLKKCDVVHELVVDRYFELRPGP